MLRARGHEVRFADAGGDYQKRRHRGAKRWLQEAWSLVRLAWVALFGSRPRVIVCFSSPPCVLVVGALAAVRHRARLLHWVMDLYPEIALELGEVPVVAGRLMAPVMNLAYRRCERIVVLDRDMGERLRRRGFEAEVMPPWYPGGLPEVPGEVAVSGEGFGRVRVWLYSGNLGRAHEWRTLLEAQRKLEEESGGAGWRLVFQGGGPQFEAARRAAVEMGLKGCEFRGYVPREQLVRSLLAADVLIATQNPLTCGCLWPSKLVLAMWLPRPVLWVGPTSSSVAEMLRARPGNGVFEPGAAVDIAGWLAALSMEPADAASKTAAADPMQAGLEQWLAWIEGGRR